MTGSKNKFLYVIFSDNDLLAYLDIYVFILGLFVIQSDYWITTIKRDHFIFFWKVVKTIAGGTSIDCVSYNSSLH